MKKVFLDRVSDRDYDGKKMSDELFKDIKDVINNAPTSTNGQQFSAVVIRDQETLNWLSEKNWNQPHIKDAAGFILFVADFNRIHHIIKQDNIEWNKSLASHEFMRGTIDATIAATYVHDWLLTENYGTCFIGGPLTYADDLHERLNLPKETMVVVGITFGKTTKRNAHKPKLDKVFLEKYDAAEANKRADEYSDATAEYWTSRGGKPYHQQITAVHVDKPGGYRKAFAEGTKYVNKKWDEITK